MVMIDSKRALSRAFVATKTQRYAGTSFRVTSARSRGLQQGDAFDGVAGGDCEEEHYVHLNDAIRPHGCDEIVRVPMKDRTFKSVCVASLNFWERWSDEIRSATRVTLIAKGGMETFLLHMDAFERGSARSPRDTFSLLREYVTSMFDDVYRSNAGGLAFWFAKQNVGDAGPDEVYRQPQT